MYRKVTKFHTPTGMASEKSLNGIFLWLHLNLLKIGVSVDWLLERNFGQHTAPFQGIVR